MSPNLSGSTDLSVAPGLFTEGLAKLNLSGSSAALLKYIEEIEFFNSAYGLVKVKDRAELIVKHILDSLAPLEIIKRVLSEHGNPQNEKPKPKIADVGSGAGLPGLPLALCFPDAEFTLIERMGRRAGFLRNCAAVLGMSNVTVEENEMEKAAPGTFDLVVFRAFRPLEAPVLKGLFRLLKPEGVLAAWKGRLENARGEMLSAEKSFPNRAWEILPVQVPFLDEERHITLIYSRKGENKNEQN